MSITLQEMEKFAAEIDTLRKEEAAASATKKAITEKLEVAENNLIKILGENDLTSYRASCGLLSIAYRTSVKTPKTAEDKQKFYDYLRSKGLYDSMISVNSQTLNSFYKSEMEQAQEAGNSEFAIPGINEVTINETLSFRRV